MLLAFGMTLVIAAAPNGEAIFKEHCTHCHGEDGKGKLAVGKPDFTNAKTQDSLTDEEIIGTITNGRKGFLCRHGREGCQQRKFPPSRLTLRSVGRGGRVKGREQEVVAIQESRLRREGLFRNKERGGQYVP